MTRSHLLTALFVVLVALIAVAGWALGHFQQPPVKTPFLCYDVQPESYMMGQTVTLADQFNEDGREYSFTHLLGVCTPVVSKVPPEGKGQHKVKQGDHLLCYEVDGPAPKPADWLFDDQFGRHEETLRKIGMLCEPADKKLVEP